MKTPEEIFEILKNKFPEDVYELEAELPVEKYITVNPLKVNEIGTFLRDEEELLFDALMVLSGVDENDGEKLTDEEGNTTVTGGNLSVYYHLDSIKLKHKVSLKALAPKENPEVESVQGVWKTANWHEREAFDMIGIKFLNHPDLRRILLPEDWQEDSFPLRKDYENPEFYHGMKIPY